MMEGNNELRLCKADMMRAVEYWLNEVVFRDDVTVVDVKELGTESMFVVKLKAPERPGIQTKGGSTP